MELQKVKILELSKKAASALAKAKVAEIVEQGQTDPLKAFIESKKTAEFFSEVSDALKPAAMKECEKHGKGGAEFWGARAEIASTPSRYNYSNCNDVILPKLVDTAEAAKKAVEARQKFLQGLPSSGETILDEDTGEMIKIYPPVKVSGETIKITY